MKKSPTNPTIFMFQVHTQTAIPAFRWDIAVVLYRVTKYRQNAVKHNLFNFYITNMFLHNL